MRLVSAVPVGQANTDEESDEPYGQRGPPVAVLSKQGDHGDALFGLGPAAEKTGLWPGTWLRAEE